MTKKYWIILLFFISLLPVLNFFHTGLPATHDGPDHVARIANFYQSLAEGNFVPRWAANLNWGYGHPILEFLYPLPSYFASIFHAVGFSFVDSTKLVFGLTYVGSILIFFIWASEQWNPAAGFIGSLIYGFAPYRFVDLYVRGDIGESAAFIFPPIIFWGLLRMAKYNSRIAFLVISLGVFGLITAHNAIALMVVPLFFLYALYLGIYSAQNKRSFFIKSTFSIALGFALSAFFWIPALLEGKYTLRNIVTRGDFSQRFVNFTQFIYSPWSYGSGNELSKELGVFTWVAIAGSVIILFKSKKREEKFFILGSLLIIASSLWIMTSGSLFLWNKIMLLQNFQFPWRFLAILVIIGAALGAFVAANIVKRYWTASVIIVSLVTLISTYFMWQPNGYVYHPEAYYSGIYNSTTDTGESSPIWSVRFMEHRAKAHMEILSGSAEIQELSRTSVRHEYKVNAADRVRILENTLYFPGWKVFVDGNETAVEFQDPNHRGLMTFVSEAGQHDILVLYTDTKLRQAADVISLLGWGVIVVLLGITLWKKR